MTDFGDMYRPSEEHEAFRAAVRELCEEKVAPNAAEADELAEFPKASLEALVAADFHAPHIPEAYSGVGADALATVIVIEEIARVCAASSLIPAVNKLATLPWLLATCTCSNVRVVWSTDTESTVPPRRGITARRVGDP